MSKIKSYFDLELKTAIVYALAGILGGYASFLARNSLAGLMAALFIFAAVSLAVKSVWKIKKPAKNWISNGLFFLLMWFVTYTIFYNI